MSSLSEEARLRRRQDVRRRRRRRRQVAAGLVIAVGLVVVVALVAAGSSGGKHQVLAPKNHAAPIPAVEAGLLPWQLPAPISREVVLPGRGSRLLILGGLHGSSSERGVFSLDIKDGSLRPVGSLSAGVHDAAGAVIGRRYVVFGGGSPATTATVKGFPAGSAAPHGVLPAPRSDATATSVGSTTFIIGGYTGSSPDASVLATSDGSTFRSVSSLPVPVRYPAVASSGGKLYVFGGQAITGTQAGRPVDDIQLVDPATHSSRVIAHMPEPLQAAAAINLRGTIYLAGGDTSTPQATAHGIGNQEVAARSSGSPPLFTTSAIWAFDLARRRLLKAGRLQVPVSHAGLAAEDGRAWLVGGESGGGQLASVQMVTPARSFGIAGRPGAGSPYFGGKLLIADRGNNRLLLLNTSGQVIWKFPSAASGPDPHGFFFPDDAFFVHHGTAIISNQEENETVQEIAYPSGKVLWLYGHPHHIGSARGYLHEPDDAYLLKNGDVTVADADNCRVLVIKPNHRIVHQIGGGGCTHHPPESLTSTNGDTPLADGNLLISETAGSWIDEVTPSGHVVWSRKLPIAYPSDPQQLGPDRYLLADYTNPGQILEFNRAGRILYRYDVTSGAGRLNQPSLVELLPSGVFMTNDDYRHRMVAIDPTTRALVWQYGLTDHPGRALGRLRIPDGFDLLMANGSTPTHRFTG